MDVQLAFGEPQREIIAEPGERRDVKLGLGDAALVGRHVVRGSGRVVCVWESAVCWPRCCVSWECCYSTNAAMMCVKSGRVYVCEG